MSWFQIFIVFCFIGAAIEVVVRTTPRRVKAIVNSMLVEVVAERDEARKAFDTCAKQCISANETVSAMHEEIGALEARLKMHGIDRDDIPGWAESVF